MSKAAARTQPKRTRAELCRQTARHAVSCCGGSRQKILENIALQNLLLSKQDARRRARYAQILLNTFEVQLPPGSTDVLQRVYVK